MTTTPIDGVRGVPQDAAPRTAAPVRHRVNELEPVQEFEAFALRTFVESMLPSKASSVFGSGTAGEIWRSMMAERLGEELARGGGIGIADMVSKDRGLGGDAATANARGEGTSARARFDAVLARSGKP